MNWSSWNDWNTYFFNGSSITRIIGAIVVLLLGLWISSAIGKAVERALSKTKMDAKGKHYFGESTSTSKMIGRVVKYFLILITILIVLQILSFSAVLNPFVGFIAIITSYLPHILGAVLLAVVAHILGTILKKMLTGLLDSPSVRGKAPKLVHYKDVVGNIAYAIVILLFAPSILATLNIPAISAPLTAVIALIISYLPKVLGAAILLIIGHYIARFVANLVRTIASSMDLQRWTGPGFDVAKFIGSVVYFLIFFPIAVQALNVLDIKSIQEPAQNILNLVMAWIPNIAVAAFLLYLGYIIAKIVRNLAITLLSPMKVDAKVSELLPMLKNNPEGLANANVSSTLDYTKPAAATYPVTRWIANIIGILVFSFFLVEATNVLKLAFISASVASLMVALPRVILVAIIIMAGILLAKVADKAVKADNPMKGFIQPIIIVLAVVIGLTEIGLASIIITSGYLIVMGALAITFIISVGIGSIPGVKRYWEKKQNRSPLQ